MFILKSFTKQEQKLRETLKQTLQSHSSRANILDNDGCCQKIILKSWHLNCIPIDAVKSVKERSHAKNAEETSQKHLGYLSENLNFWSWPSPFNLNVGLTNPRKQV